jgi:cytochrome P450
VAAIDTSIATTISLVKALVCFPEVQKKVQEEVDRVVGRDRLPVSADLPNLPYCRAFVREVMRWREITRIGVPHASSADDVYQGYLWVLYDLVSYF